MYQWIHTRDKIWMDGDGYHGKYTRPYTVNCGPRSEVIISVPPKREIHVKANAFAHAAADLSERGIASIHLDVRSVMVKM